MVSGHCVFCDIVNDDAPATIVDSWVDAIAIVPLDPVVDGHVLILPRVHVANFIEDPDVTAATVRRAAEFVAANSSFGPGDYNLITSAGAAATQTIMHLHVHIVPRHDGDGLTLPWTGQHDAKPHVEPSPWGAPQPGCALCEDATRQICATLGDRSALAACVVHRP